MNAHMVPNDFDEIEERRLRLQAELDGAKTAQERNRMGQFATPTGLARSILKHGLSLLSPEVPVRFLDPGIGTGSFYSALLHEVGNRTIDHATGFEIDAHYGVPAGELWSDQRLELRFEDFTTAVPGEDERANLLICNPPYVRHHHLDSEAKVRIQASTEQACGVRISGLSGLYCYFMGLSHAWMQPDAIAAWLIPSEFMGVNYGQQLKQYLLGKVTLMHIHRFDPADVQFADALVSSAVVWIKNTPPPRDHSVLFTFGGTLEEPALSRSVTVEELRNEKKWTRYPEASEASTVSELTLGDLFTVKRGLATGDNGFFIMNRETIEKRGLPMECFRPVLPSSRYIPEDEIEADDDGNPLIEKKLFLLDTRLDESEIKHRYPELDEYLETGRSGEKPVAERYLCKARKPWYSQENRLPAPLLSTYMGRGRDGSRPFRFILNHSQATACNVFLMLYPKPMLQRAMQADPLLLRDIWRHLNEMPSEVLLGHGRVYGGGLHKLEPKELRAVPMDHLVERISEPLPVVQGDLFSARSCV